MCTYAYDEIVKSVSNVLLKSPNNGVYLVVIEEYIPNQLDKLERPFWEYPPQ